MYIVFTVPVELYTVLSDPKNLGKDLAKNPGRDLHQQEVKVKEKHEQVQQKGKTWQKEKNITLKLK